MMLLKVGFFAFFSLHGPGITPGEVHDKVRAVPRTFRLWMAGQEAGGREEKLENLGGVQRYQSREWIKLERLGMEIGQEIHQEVRKFPDGRLEFTWMVKLATEPMEGRATWHPSQPDKLRIFQKGLPEKSIEIAKEAVLWPPEGEEKLKAASRARKAITLHGFSPVMQKSTEMALEPVGPSPLPGFPDTVQFKGKNREGAMSSEVEMWVSPTHGEIKDFTSLGGIQVVIQRAELPAAPSSTGPGLFERTLKPLPAHPFLPWKPEATLRWDGKGEQRLPLDPQQICLGTNRYLLRQAAPLSQEDACQLPVQGTPAPTDAAYLAPSLLLQFQDPKFDGIIHRMRLSKTASRWELAKAVNAFVFDWITEKDYTVGFASALEVIHRPKGDCTEHGVLTVALLRKLGVPSRGVMGWVGANGVMGLHFWVEVKLNNRWIAVDPTFNEAPASALRLKLADTDLSDLGSVGWDAAASNIAEGQWVPEGSWNKDLNVQAHAVTAPGGIRLSLPGGKWALHQGRLTLNQWGIEGVTQPTPQMLTSAKPIQVSGKRKGFWQKNSARLYLEVLEAKWLALTGLNEAEAIEVLEKLQASRG